MGFWSAVTRTWFSLTEIREHAKKVVWHCVLVPEVHNHSVVFWIRASANNDELLESCCIIRLVVYITIASPDHVSTVLRVN